MKIPEIWNKISEGVIRLNFFKAIFLYYLLTFLLVLTAEEDKDFELTAEMMLDEEDYEGTLDDEEEMDDDDDDELADLQKVSVVFICYNLLLSFDVRLKRGPH